QHAHPARRPVTVPVEEEEEAEDDRPAAVLPGRITGTIIDRRSGAPAPGIRVQIGDTFVVSDGNGNYDRNGVVPGNYTVALVLGEGQGEAAQGPIEVTIASGETVVQHLAFFSPLAQATATAAPTTPATTATPLATVPAVATAAPPPTAVPVPEELPATGGESPVALTLFLIGFGIFTIGLMVRSLKIGPFSGILLARLFQRRCRQRGVCTNWRLFCSSCRTTQSYHEVLMVCEVVA
ncbi:carboxypeptidase regulatory-like domain-containing protein, partial [Candidatus Gracilibacteria bacterium]|nr:carboxypeptidase regulatory-like domain-containing protein [Candidatus Gracilibacteria bacterium]